MQGHDMEEGGKMNPKTTRKKLKALKNMEIQNKS